MKDAWVQVTPSEYPWEREGLAFLKERLPDHEPFRAWANFEFLVDGTVSEVDVLVVARRGIFLVELKGWPGRITGDAGTWQWTPPNAVEPRLHDNPYVLANRKAKRLKGLLSRQKALRGKHVPFIRPLIFLSDPDVVVSLSEEARAGVTRREDGELPGVIAALTKLTADEQRRGERAVDRPMAKLIASAIEQAGIRPSQKRRQAATSSSPSCSTRARATRTTSACTHASPPYSTASASTAPRSSRPRRSASSSAAPRAASTSCCTASRTRGSSERRASSSTSSAPPWSSSATPGRSAWTTSSSATTPR